MDTKKGIVTELWVITPLVSIARPGKWLKKFSGRSWNYGRWRKENNRRKNKSLVHSRSVSILIPDSAKSASDISCFAQYSLAEKFEPIIKFYDSGKGYNTSPSNVSSLVPCVILRSKPRHDPSSLYLLDSCLRTNFRLIRLEFCTSAHEKDAGEIRYRRDGE